MRQRILVMIAIAAALVAVLSVRPAPSQQEQAGDTSRVQKKIQQVHENAPRWVAAGGDRRRIEPLAEQLDKFLKAGQLREAEESVDKILAILEAAPSGAPAAAEATSPATKPVPVKLGKIPPQAEIVYNADSFIYVMDGNGKDVTQITFTRRHWEHVAVSHDRKRVVANEWARPAEGGASSRLWVFDLEQGTEARLLPDFRMAGNGGVDWDPHGFIYFAGIERNVVATPRTKADFIANAAANDVYKVKWDGTGLTRLTNTTDRGEADVQVSADGTLVACMATKIDPPNDYTEIWVMNSDGTNRRLVYKGGKDKVASVHDPAFSPDKKKVVFSKVNPNFKNFRSDPNANTAHDLWVINIDGTGLTRLTEPGPISIIPDWTWGSRVVYTQLSDQVKPPYLGTAVIQSDATGHRRVLHGPSQGKWIPPLRY